MSRYPACLLGGKSSNSTNCYGACGFFNDTDTLVYFL
jgi:hypothetical protein